MWIIAAARISGKTKNYVHVYVYMFVCVCVHIKNQLYGEEV